MLPHSRLIIASDLDGTIIDHTELKQRIAARYGFAFSPAECASDAMKQKVPADVDRAIKTQVYGRESLASPIMLGAKEALTTLQEEFGAVYIISRRTGTAEGNFAMDWLHTHLIPPLEENNIFFVPTDADKDAVAKGKNITLYIDDKEEVLDKMPSVTHRVLMDPFNNFPHSRYRRVNNWEEFLALAQGI